MISRKLSTSITLVLLVSLCLAKLSVATAFDPNGDAPFEANQFLCIDDTKFKQFTSSDSSDFVIESCPPGLCQTRKPRSRNPCIGAENAQIIDGFVIDEEQIEVKTIGNDKSETDDSSDEESEPETDGEVEASTGESDAKESDIAESSDISEAEPGTDGYADASTSESEPGDGDATESSDSSAEDSRQIDEDLTSDREPSGTDATANDDDSEAKDSEPPSDKYTEDSSDRDFSASDTTSAFDPNGNAPFAANQFLCINDTKFKHFKSSDPNDFVTGSCATGFCQTRKPRIKNPCVGKANAQRIDGFVIPEQRPVGGGENVSRVGTDDGDSKDPSDDESETDPPKDGSDDDKQTDEPKNGSDDPYQPDEPDGGTNDGDNGGETDNGDEDPEPDDGAQDDLVAPVTSNFKKDNGEFARALDNAKGNNKEGAECNGNHPDLCIGSTSFGQCVNGKIVLAGSCGPLLSCFHLPLVNKRGTTIACTTSSDFESRIAAALSSRRLLRRMLRP